MESSYTVNLSKICSYLHYNIIIHNGFSVFYKTWKNQNIEDKYQNPESMGKTKITCVSGEMHIPQELCCDQTCYQKDKRYMHQASNPVKLREFLAKLQTCVASAEKHSKYSYTEKQLKHNAKDYTSPYFTNTNFVS